VSILLLGGCERKVPAPPRDSLAPTNVSAVAGHSPALDRSGWNRAAGPALFIQGASLDEAIAIYPFADDSVDQERVDSMGTEGTAVALFGRGGARLGARLGVLPDQAEASCERWVLRDVRPQGSVPVTAWSVGFADARVAPMALDSMEALSPRDSASLAAEASRLASGVTAPTGPSFQGLRFAAHDVRRFQAAPGVQAIVAHLKRQVNQEANPQQEQTLLIAERDSGATAGPFQLAYAERSFGREEEVITLEVLAAARFGDGAHPTLVVARDGEAGVAYAFVERAGKRQWRARWTSALAKCG
jgi:hypothetical protein